MNIWQEIKAAGPQRCWQFLGGEEKYNIDASLEEHRRRDAFIANYSFAVPSQEAIKAIADFVGEDKVLEVGAGSGLWAKLLSDQGVHVTAIDNLSWNGRSSVALQFGKFHLIERLNSSSAVRRYRDHSVLLFIWPPLHNQMSVRALRLFSGNKVVYIGEWQAATATPSFHKLLRKEWKEMAEVAIP
jgi:hypothetical protein